jgi:hypothetical protein
MSSSPACASRVRCGAGSAATRAAPPCHHTSPSWGNLFEQFGVQDQLDEPAAQQAQVMLEVAGLAEPQVDPVEQLFHHRPDAALGDGQEEVFLAAEVLADSLLRDPGGGGDVVHAGAHVAVAQEFTDRGALDPLALALRPRVEVLWFDPAQRLEAAGLGALGGRAAAAAARPRCGRITANRRVSVTRRDS